MAAKNYSECGLCKTSHGGMTNLLADGYKLNPEGLPVVFCNYGFLNPNEKIKLTNGNLVDSSPIVHYVCCLLFCEQNHNFPCGHRLYSSKKLEKLILENKDTLTADPSSIRKLI